MRRLKPATMAHPNAAQRNFSAVPICAHSEGLSGCGSIRRSLVKPTGRRSRSAGIPQLLAKRYLFQQRKSSPHATIYLISASASLSTRNSCHESRILATIPLSDEFHFTQRRKQHVRFPKLLRRIQRPLTTDFVRTQPNPMIAPIN